MTAYKQIDWKVSVMFAGDEGVVKERIKDAHHEVMRQLVADPALTHVAMLAHAEPVEVILETEEDLFR